MEKLLLGKTISHKIDHNESNHQTKHLLKVCFTNFNITILYRGVGAENVAFFNIQIVVAQHLISTSISPI